MASAGRILWIDNDLPFLGPFRWALEYEGYQVTIAGTVSDAENFLTGGNYDLVIIDVMMPLTEEDEAAGYSPALTGQGLKTGLAFYIRNRDLFLTRRIEVIVMTVRIDQDIVDEFAAAGVPRRCMVTKFEVGSVVTFLQKIRSTLDADTGQT